ncbi:MFS transporter [Pseudoxanthomonas sacheonensis]|uniref:MFS transporter n=1 Tax=Pseudoxanthomonas sacheonensis TaxID=443615 RepID=UPI0013D73C5E|nr:MFS transporter [Pseudoxanthomonas sacheonensis]KAF1710774.1 MFS transporter [Pseudoxanthomonas sacheonensis]
MNPQRLFVASCIALLATAMSFAIRGDIMGELELAFELDKIQLGWISGAAFWGFGLSILFGGTLCDLLGMGRLLKLAAVGHIAGVLLTVFATDFTMLFAATVVIGIANGFVEAGINPLIATLYREDKTARLVKLHAWFPGGIVVGGVLAFAFTQLGLGWQSKMLLMLVPSAIYAVMFFAQRFPDSERKAAGVSTAAMYGELKRPLFLVVFVCMWLTAATELGPGQWVSNIFNEVMHSTLQAGVLLLVWINGIMYALRQFGGVLAHRLSPVTLIAVTAPIAALGLWLFGRADTPVLAFAAAALLAVGTAFWWPTMLGLTSERFPRGGALALAMVGAAGAFSTAVAGPVMGWINNTYGATNVLPVWAVLPVLIALIFGILHLVDRARGGYRIERVDA